MEEGESEREREEESENSNSMYILVTDNKYLTFSGTDFQGKLGKAMFIR